MPDQCCLSIVIVNWNTAELLLACLKSIQRFPPHHPYEIIVVDNASQDGSAERVRRDFPEVKLLGQAHNFGYAKGNNIGVAEATGTYILTLNPDTEAFPATFDTAIAFLESHDGVGVIGAKQIGSDGRVQKSIRGFPTVLGVFSDSIGLARAFSGTRFDSYRLKAFDYNLEQSAPQPMGTFLMFRRTALQAIGAETKPFDEDFPIFFNEVDLLFRLRQAGWPCFYVPTVELKHYGGESTKLVRKSIIWESHKSLLRYWKKHSKSFWDKILLALAWLPIEGLAFVRAKGYDKGFRPDGYNLQLEHKEPDSPMP